MGEQKPLNIHFKIEDDAVIDALEGMLKEYRKKRGDWRLRNAALAKFIVESVAREHEELLRDMVENAGPESEQMPGHPTAHTTEQLPLGKRLKHRRKAGP